MIKNYVKQLTQFKTSQSDRAIERILLKSMTIAQKAAGSVGKIALSRRRDGRHLCHL